MNRFDSVTKPLMWSMALLLVAFVAGCGSGGGLDPILGGGGAGGIPGAPPNAIIPGPGAVCPVAGPTVISTIPSNGDINVPTSTSGAGGGKLITATFSLAMNPATIITPATSFTVKETVSGINVPGIVTMNAANTTATFTTSSALSISRSYTAIITQDAKSNATNTPLCGIFAWSFTTAASTAPGQASVNLGTAAPFGNLGGTAGTTNTGTLTVIGGDLGSTATATSAVTGFHDSAGDIYTQTGANMGTVTGKIFTCTVSTTGPTSAAVNAASCTIATNARNDAITAFNNLAALPPGANPGGNLAGLTLAPGVYTAPAGSFLIQGGDLTLDAQGNANAVWVFQMATTLLVGGPGVAFPQSVILKNGAQAKNVFWQVGTSATINAAGGGTMVGTILASSAVSFSTVGNVTILTLNGRAAGLNASVTMTNTVINVPAP